MHRIRQSHQYQNKQEKPPKWLTCYSDRKSTINYTPCKMPEKCLKNKIWETNSYKALVAEIQEIEFIQLRKIHMHHKKKWWKENGKSTVHRELKIPIKHLMIWN